LDLPFLHIKHLHHLLVNVGERSGVARLLRIFEKPELTVCIMSDHLEGDAAVADHDEATLIGSEGDRGLGKRHLALLAIDVDVD
jgi:hypothetical protein